MSLRRLAVILAADVVGSSRLIQADEAEALEAIGAALHQVLVEKATQSGGRLIKTMGDGALLEFSSPVSAVMCAHDVQGTLVEQGKSVDPEKRVVLRIGINIADVLVAPDGDLYGDGVNVAVRLEGIAAPGGICISDKVFEELSGKLSLAWEDRGNVELKNIAKPVRVWSRTYDGDDDQKSRADKSGMSLVILPFQNLYGGSDQDYFADGLVDGLTTDIAQHVPSLTVVGRGSAFSYKGRSVQAQQVGRELGVRYLLNGSVQRSGPRVRVNAYLINTRDGAQLWSERFEGSNSDLFALQDEITARIANSLGLVLYETNVRAEQDSTIVDLNMRGWAALYLGDRSEAAFDRAEPFYRKVLEREPDNPDALIGLAAVSAGRLFNFRQFHISSAQRREEVLGAQKLLDVGLERKPNFAMAHSARGILLSVERRWREALPEFHRARSLDPSSVFYRLNYGNTEIALGHPEKAIETFQEAIRCSPRDPSAGVLNMGIGRAALLLGRWEEALQATLLAKSRLPGFIYVQLEYCAILAQSGLLVEAKGALAGAYNIVPHLSLDWLRRHQWSNEPEYLRLAEGTLFDGLLKAGLPEHEVQSG